MNILIQRLLIKISWLTFLLIAVSSCEQSTNQHNTEAIQQPSLILPVDATPMTLTGTMDFWFIEGEAGCYGSFVVNKQEIQLYSEIHLCEHIHYEKGAPATVTIIFDQRHQYAPDEYAIYTITQFDEM